MIELLKKYLDILTELYMLPIGSASRIIKFLFVVSNIVSLLLLIIFILIFFLVKNKTLKTISAVLLSLFLLFFIAQIAVFVDMALIEPNWLKVEYVDIHCPRLATALKGVKIVYFSDLHVNGIGFREKQLIKIINSLKPDIILFTGGFTGEDLKHLGDAIPDAAWLFRQLKARLGIWAVADSTDDEVFEMHPNLRKQIMDTRINLLSNQSVKFEFESQGSFWLVGTEDTFYGKSGLAKATFRLPVSEPKIVITHSPNIIDSVSEYKVDLVLVGKTHGGHTGVKFLRDFFSFTKQFKYISGLYKVKDTYLYVNRGIGGKTSPYRFLCRPEITVLNITD